MPYQGIAFAFLLGVGVAAATIFYFLNEQMSENANRQRHSYEPERPPRSPEPAPSSWAPKKKNNNRNSKRRQQRSSEKCDNCCICFDPLIPETRYVRELKCSHRFHIVCINGWIKEKGPYADCPNCRERIRDGC